MELDSRERVTAARLHRSGRGSFKVEQSSSQDSSGLTPTFRTRKVRPIHQLNSLKGFAFPQQNNPTEVGLFCFGRTTRQTSFLTTIVKRIWSNCWQATFFEGLYVIEYSKHYEVALRKDLSPENRKQALIRLSEDEIYSLMAREVRELSARLSRAEARLDSQTAITGIAQLLLAFLGLIGSFALSVWPYIGSANASIKIVIPDMISYLSAFVVVIFAFFLYFAYREVATLLQYRKEAQFIVKAGKRALDEAKSVFSTMREEIKGNYEIERS